MKKRGKLSAALGALTLAGATILVSARPAAAADVRLALTYDHSSPIIGWSAKLTRCVMT